MNEPSNELPQAEEEQESRRGVIIISPRLSPSPTPPLLPRNELELEPEQDEESTSARELFFQSLLNGQTSQARRQPRPRPQSVFSQDRIADDNEVIQSRERSRLEEEERQQIEHGQREWIDQSLREDLRALTELTRLRNQLQIRIGQQQPQEEVVGQVEGISSASGAVWRVSPFFSLFLFSPILL